MTIVFRCDGCGIEKGPRLTHDGTRAEIPEGWGMKTVKLMGQNGYVHCCGRVPCFERIEGKVRALNGNGGVVTPQEAFEQAYDPNMIPMTKQRIASFPRRKK